MKNIEQRLKQKLSDQALGLDDISKDVTLKLNELESNEQQSDQVDLSNQTHFSQIPQLVLDFFNLLWSHFCK